jgi:hypothetical protein
MPAPFDGGHRVRTYLARSADDCNTHRHLPRPKRCVYLNCRQRISPILAARGIRDIRQSADHGRATRTGVAAKSTNNPTRHWCQRRSKTDPYRSGVSLQASLTSWDRFLSWLCTAGSSHNQGRLQSSSFVQGNEGTQPAAPAWRPRQPKHRHPSAEHRMGDINRSNTKAQSRLWESNPRPTHYECVALAV